MYAHMSIDLDHNSFTGRIFLAMANFILEVLTYLLIVGLCGSLGHQAVKEGQTSVSLL